MSKTRISRFVDQEFQEKILDPVYQREVEDFVGAVKSYAKFSKLDFERALGSDAGTLARERTIKISIMHEQAKSGRFGPEKWADLADLIAEHAQDHARLLTSLRAPSTENHFNVHAPTVENQSKPKGEQGGGRILVAVLGMLIVGAISFFVFR